jgi:membrane-associated phospholipid phosphatase
MDRIIMQIKNKLVVPTREEIILRLAQFLSILFHPLWMPLVIYISVREIDPYYIAPTEADMFVFLLLGINIVAPAISMLVMIKYGMLSSIDLRNRKERFGPYMLVIFYYIVSYGMLKWKGPYLPDSVFSFFLSVIVSLIISMLINLYWKISVHMLAQGGIFGTLLGLNVIHPNMDLLYPAMSLVVAALTAYSRLYLNAHTHGQVYAGFCLGTCANWLIISGKLMI